MWKDECLSSKNRNAAVTGKSKELSFATRFSYVYEMCGFFNITTSEAQN